MAVLTASMAESVFGRPCLQLLTLFVQRPTTLLFSTDLEGKVSQEFDQKYTDFSCGM